MTISQAEDVRKNSRIIYLIYGNTLNPLIAVTSQPTTMPLVHRARNTLMSSVLSLWVFLILVSVLLVHQHHLIDVAAGLLLAYPCFALIYRPMTVTVSPGEKIQ